MIRIEVAGTQAERGLTMLEREQLPFATSLALNETAKRFQELQFSHMQRSFTLRRPDWAKRSIKITHFATKQFGRNHVTIGVVAPGRGDRSDILGKFEADWMKRPRGERLAVAAEALRAKYGKSRTGVIPRNIRPRALGFEPVGRRVFSGKGTGVWKGKQRTFMIKLPGGRGGIFQRQGRGKNSRLVLLFRFIPFAQGRDRLHFEDNARQTVRLHFEQEFRKALSRAMATRR